MLEDFINKPVKIGIDMKEAAALMGVTRMGGCRRPSEQVFNSPEVLLRGCVIAQRVRLLPSVRRFPSPLIVGRRAVQE